MKKRPSKKLTLDAETIRHLTGSQAQEAAGGRTIYYTCPCSMGCPTGETE
jgi:hypothetical protein